MPQEAAESTAQMRKVIVDQIEALAELNRIVAHHGRGLDVVTQGRATVRQEEPALAVAVGGGGGGGGRTSASTLPPPDLGMQQTARRTEAPPVSPANTDGGDGWLSGLLSRTDGGGQPQPQRGRAQGPANPLESLSLDIGRLMDRNLAAEMWDCYQRGESKAFSKRLYTPAGQKAFDEVARTCADCGFKQTVDRYIAESERLLDEVARDERGPQALRPLTRAWSTPCSPMPQAGSDTALSANEKGPHGLRFAFADVLIRPNPAGSIEIMKKAGNQTLCALLTERFCTARVRGSTSRQPCTGEVLNNSYSP
jgi:hypothetical protein